MKTFAKIITYVLLILILLGAVGLVYKFTNGGTTNFKTFYVQNGKTIYTQDSGDYALSAGEELKFDVHYTFGFFHSDGSVKDYSVKIIANVTDDTKFEYTVDGETHTWSEEADLSAVFNLNKSDSYFTFTIPQNLTMAEVLTQICDGAVTVEDLSIGAKCYFALIVTSYDGQSTIRINFRRSGDVTGIKLNTESIIF